MFVIYIVARTINVLYIYEIVVISRSPTCTDDSINMVTMTSLGDVVVQQAVLKKLLSDSQPVF